MRQKEIYIVRYPEETVGHEYKKERPALVIESNSQIKKTNIFTVVPLTSNLKNKIEDDVLIKKDETNNLFCDSILKVHHIESFDKDRFIAQIGEVNESIMDKVKRYLKIHFDLS